jgi:hypothetical protein
MPEPAPVTSALFPVSSNITMGRLAFRRATRQNPSKNLI